MKDINLKTIGKYFYNLGFNITCISNYRNDYNLIDRNLLKAPNHEWQTLANRRQTLSEFESYDWGNVIGIGTVLGFNNLMALDIDGCVEKKFVYWVCNLLGISNNYEWLIESGSGAGFHLIFLCNDRHFTEEDKWNNYSDVGTFYSPDHSINAYYPQTTIIHSCYGNGLNSIYNKDIYNGFLGKQYFLSDLFQKIEFRWANHLVLPNSIHESGLKYQFLNDFPTKQPQVISFDKFKELHQLLCSSRADFSGWEGTADHNLAHEDELTINQASQKFHAKYIPDYLVMDIETNGSNLNSENIPEIVQLAWVVVDPSGNVINHGNFLIKPDGYSISNESIRFHNITNELTHLIGYDFKIAVSALLKDLANVKFLVCHNYEFLAKVLSFNMGKYGIDSNLFMSKKYECTSVLAKKYGYANQNKYGFLKITDLYNTLFESDLQPKYNAFYDSIITKICFNKLTMPLE